MVYQHSHYLIPVEVKSGPQGKLRSLHQFMERSEHIYALRLLSNNFRKDKVQLSSGKQFTLYNLPYFLSSKIPEYLDWIIRSG